MIDVGEYVRTEYNGIKRCVHINEEEITNMYWLAGKMVEDIEKKVFIYYGDDYKKIDIDEVVKHSKNIIDLIEVGDYVISKDGIEGKVDFVMLPLKIFVNGEEVLNEDIKSIVTKEQFENIEYIVEYK